MLLITSLVIEISHQTYQNVYNMDVNLAISACNSWVFYASPLV